MKVAEEDKAEVRQCSGAEDGKNLAEPNYGRTLRPDEEAYLVGYLLLIGFSRRDRRPLRDRGHDADQDRCLSAWVGSSTCTRAVVMECCSAGGGERCWTVGKGDLEVGGETEVVLLRAEVQASPKTEAALEEIFGDLAKCGRELSVPQSPIL